MKTYLFLALSWFTNKLSAQLILGKPATCFAFRNAAEIQSIENQFMDSLNFAPPASKKIEVTPAKINFWRLHWDNDYWIPTQKTDRYYTNGIYLEYYFAKNRLNKPFWNFIFPRIDPKADNYYGVHFQTDMYTPDSIWTQQPNDRPYCGLATVGMTCISKQSQTGIRLTTEYRIGILGPATMQAELQHKWHQFLDKPIPVGWNTQIPNAFAFNVHWTYEQPFNDFSNVIETIWLADMNVGTIATNAGTGLRIHAGHFHKAKQYGINLLDVQKRQHYVYFQSMVHFVVANATLQGGISLKDAERKPYIQIDNLTRTVAETTVAYHVDWGNWGLEYRFQHKSPEWAGGKSTFWGSFNLQKGF
jgi:lipid A 3-O-deacylase